jgi:hypothetical protein
MLQDAAGKQQISAVAPITKKHSNHFEASTLP